MKKLTLSILAAGVAALTLASCGGDSTNTSGSTGANTSTPTSTVTTTASTTQATDPTTATTTATDPTTTGDPANTDPTGSPSTPDPVEDLAYAIDVDMTILDGNIGITFSGLNSSNFLMWQLAIGEYNDGNLYLRPHTWQNGAGASIKALEIVVNDVEGLEDISTELGATHHMTIRVFNDGSIETLINGVSVYTTDLVNDLVLTDDPGLIGFRCDAYNNGTIPEVGLFDNLKITDASGTVLYEDDFSSEDSTLCQDLLDGDHAVLEDGALKITGKYLNMTYVTEL